MEYSKDERVKVIEFIEKNFGKIGAIYEDVGYDDLYLDMARIDPTEKKPYYTFVTLGMGENKMYNQNNENFSSYSELMITFPKNLLDEGRSCDWAIDYLLHLAHLPFVFYFSYEWGHLENNFEPFSNQTKLSAFTFLYPEMSEKNSGVLKLESRKLQFYQLVALYEEEYQYALKNGIKDLLLLDKDRKITYFVDMRRDKVLEYSEEDKDYLEDVMDSASYHLGDYYSKGIEVDEINIYNHLAIFLRWSKEKNLLSKDFVRIYKNELENSDVDLRELIKYRLGGDLRKSFFSDGGKEFVRHYFDYDFLDDEKPFYPADIDDYAKKIFGEERYYSPELKREAYLYINYDEKYYGDMKKTMDEVYDRWLEELESQVM